MSLSEMVAVRFEPEVIDRAKRCADFGGMSVSNWIRCVVKDAILRTERQMRQVSFTANSAAGYTSEEIDA